MYGNLFIIFLFLSKALLYKNDVIISIKHSKASNMLSIHLSSLSYDFTHTFMTV